MSINALCRTGKQQLKGSQIGASGARILVTLLYEMKRRDAHKGLATLCIGGGQGVAVAVGR